MIRSTPPAINPVTSIKPLRAETEILANGVPVYIIRGADEPVLNLTVLFPAGARFQSQRLIAGTVGALITEGGSEQYPAASLAGMIDFHGSTLHSNADKDYATISLLTLQKHLETLLPVFTGVIRQPLFPETELKIHLKQNRQKWLIELQKTRYHAMIEMAEMLYGPNHPYGERLQKEDFKKVKSRALRQFFADHYSSPVAVLLSGCVSDADVRQVHRFLGTLPFRHATNTVPERLAQVPAGSERRRRTLVPDSVQSAIRIAAPICTPLHPDYTALMVMNTLLGGYFGSRLMSSIREDKGYTYGIYSILVHLAHAHTLFIATETGTEVTLPALEAIYHEIEVLQHEPPSEEELFRVKQFMMGDLLRSFDGPFQQEERLLHLLELSLPLDYYDQMPARIQQVTPQDISAMAQKYLDKTQLREVVSGALNT